jgi:hypothetical protein
MAATKNKALEAAVLVEGTLQNLSKNGQSSNLISKQNLQLNQTTN